MRKYLCLSNSVPYPEYLYLSKLAFLVKRTAPSKQFSNFEYPRSNFEYPRIL